MGGSTRPPDPRRWRTRRQRSGASLRRRRQRPAGPLGIRRRRHPWPPGRRKTGPGSMCADATCNRRRIGAAARCRRVCRRPPPSAAAAAAAALAAGAAAWGGDRGLAQARGDNRSGRRDSGRNDRWVGRRTAHHRDFALVCMLETDRQTDRQTDKWTRRQKDTGRGRLHLRARRADALARRPLRRVLCHGPHERPYPPPLIAPYQARASTSLPHHLRSCVFVHQRASMCVCVCARARMHARAPLLVSR